MTVEEIIKRECPECGRIIECNLTIGEPELYDGWHGECWNGFCYGTVFVAIDPERKIQNHVETPKEIHDRIVQGCTYPDCYECTECEENEP